MTNDDKRKITALATRLARERFPALLEAWNLRVKPVDSDWRAMNEMHPDNSIYGGLNLTDTEKLFEAAYAYEMCRLWMEVLERRLPEKELRL